MRKIAIITGVSLAFAATPALAQEESDAGGPFIGVVGGYDQFKVNDGSESGNADGAVYGITAGYDVVSGHALFGIEAEINDSTASQDVTDVVSVDAGRDIYGGIRLGYIIENGTVVYLKGGYTNARVSIDATNGSLAEFSENLNGLRLGIGVETEISGFTARFEYRYSEYGNIEDLGTATPFDFEHNQAVIVIGKRF